MFDDKDIEIINQDDKEYYDGKLYQVGIWPGAGYQLATFKVYANSEEEALNLVVANAEINAPGLLMSIQEIEDLIAEDYQEEYNEFISENPESDDFTFATEYLNYIYVDATMEGASQPYFVTGDNLVIEELDDKKEESINTVSDKPHYIAKCTLEATEDIPNIYLLLDDKDSGGISGLDIVLVESRFGNLMYNTDYNVKDLEIVKTVYNLTELVNFMKTKGEDLSSMVTDKGIPVGFGDMLPEDLNHYIIGEEGDPTLEESKKVEKINDYEYVIYRQRLTKSPIYVKDYSTETENKDEAITFPTEHEAEEYRDELELSYKEQYKIGVKTESKDNDTIHISKNDDMKEIHTQPGQITGNNVNKMKKQVKTESENNSANIVWEHIEDYSQDEIDEIRNILEDLEVEAVKISDHSVAVKIKSNGMIFWLDYAQEGDDIVGDWNQYIFSTVNSIDRIREAIQTSYFKDTGDTFAFDIMESAGLEYLEKNGVVVYTDEGYRFNDNLKENKKLNEKYNQDGFPNNEELEDLFTRQGTLPDEITIDDRKYAMTEYGGTGENAWVIYSDTDNDDSYIRVYYSMNKLGKDSYQGVKKILGVSDLREAKQIKNEYYVKPDDEHIIWDSEFDINNFDMDDLKDTHYQNYLDNFDDTVTPMDYEDWLDSNECANYFDLEWEEAAKENDYFSEWYEFITEYVSDEEKEEAYNEYVENCNNTKLQPKDFEEWLDDNTNQLAEDDWEIKEEDLDVNILPEIDRQINYDTLILTGYYGSNYPDFRSSGNGGKMFDSVEDFKNYMGNFDRVCITTKNGILGSILNDHDGTVSGQFYTLPENLTDLVKAINYEQYVDIPEDITDEAEILETVIDQFEEDLVYGGVDTSDLTNHIELLVPIKDTISGYTPDPEPKKESREKEYRYITNHGIGPGTMPKDTYIRSEDLDNGKTAIYLNRPLTQQELDKYDIKPEWVQESKEKDDPNKYCAICGKEKEDYEASMCDDCWEKEQKRLNNTKLETIKDKQQDKDIERESKKVEESKNNAIFEIDYANDDLTRTYGTKKDIIESVTRWLGDLAKQVEVNVMVERGPSGGWPVVSLTGNKEKIAKFLLDNFNSGAEETLDEIYDLYLVKENKNVLECNNIKKVEAVEYISKKDYDKLPDDYKTTIGKTLKARQAVGDNIEKLRQLYKDLGYNEDDPMIMANEKGGTILKPVKVQESKMSEIDIDVKNTLKQFDDYLENEGYDEVDDDVVNEFFTEIFYNIDTEEELEAMNIAEKKIRHKYGLREAKELRHPDLKNNVKDYYAKNYADDELGNNIKDNVTFLQLYRALKDNTDIYDLLGTADSTVRERVFKELAKILNTNYDYVYNIWQNGTTDGQPNIIKETKTLNEEEVVSTYTDNSSTVKIVKANNGRYFNYYYDGDDKEHWSSSAGPFDTAEEAEQMAKKHRPEIKKENKSNIETVYVPEKDMTIIFEETTDDNDNPTSTEIKGFYYGSPSDDETKKFTGKLKATYDTIQESKTLVEDNTDPEEVANEIQTARENSENDTLSIEQVASSLDVLIVDEQGAIDGYKSYLEQAKQVVSEELYNSIDTQIQEIIKDEEDHIVKLNTMKDTLLGNTDNTPATDINNTDDILNPETKIESKELCLEAEPETKTGTKREELNTGVLPIVNVDMYSMEDLNNYDIDRDELDEIVMEIAPKYIEDTISEILPNVSVVAKSVYHPKQYNYSGDELEFDLVVDNAGYETLRDITVNNADFAKYLKDNYSSSSGFVSYMANNIDDFKTQEEWKQMVQVIMFNIPEDKIELNNDQYITEFMDNVYMNYAPIDDEDDLTENKSLKTENKDEWVKNWEELNSMIEYYAEQEGFTLNDNDLYDITNALAEKGVLDTFADFKSNEDKAKNTIIAAIEQFPNKVEESTEDLDDDDDDFPYDNTTEKKCPKCGKTYTDFPALSRKDNKTYICPQCGGKEAMEDYLKSLKEDNSVDTEEFKVGDVVTDLIDNDLAVIEEIDDTRKSKYLLRFVEQPVMGEAFWYEPGRFEKVTDEETIKEALDIYNRNMKK